MYIVMFVCMGGYAQSWHLRRLYHGALLGGSI